MKETEKRKYLNKDFKISKFFMYSKFYFNKLK